jgi:hypothetical protein
MKITLDNNCLISLDTQDKDSPAIRQILHLHKKGIAQVFIPEIAASENLQGGKRHENFREFEQFLVKIGCYDCGRLAPLCHVDVTYIDHCVVSTSELDELEESVHRILFPKMPFRYADYCRLKGIAPNSGIIDKKWRRARCDVSAMWCHIHYVNDVFVTNDSNFHKATKKPRLLALGAKEILRPIEVVLKFSP